MQMIEEVALGDRRDTYRDADVSRVLVIAVGDLFEISRNLSCGVFAYK
jgi:hypothetical protein